MNNIAHETLKYGMVLVLAKEDDAQFLVDLRQGDRNIHISKTDPDIQKQITWLKRYGEREKQGLEYYFIVKDKNGKAWGTIRLYNFNENNFEIGSWVFLPGSPDGIAIKSDIIARELAFEVLGFNKCTFNVRKANKQVLRYHLAYRPTIVSEDEENLFFELDKEAFYEHRNKLFKLI
jgi:RimJ/RimL family protein N-acetyltransferase